MPKSLEEQLKVKEAERVKYLVTRILPIVVIFFLLSGKALLDNWSTIFPPPPPTPTATQTTTPTPTQTVTSTPPYTLTPTITPTPTPLPISIIVNWNRVAVFAIPSSGSENVTDGGYLEVDTKLELIRYCGVDWGLVRYPNRYGEYGWVFLDTTFKSLVVENDWRPIQEVLKEYRHLQIDCPENRYTPVP